MALGFRQWNQGSSPVMEASVVSGAPVPDKVFPDLDILEGNQDLASPSAEQLMELSFSSCHDKGSEESDEEGAHLANAFVALRGRKHRLAARCCCRCRSTGSSLAEYTVQN